MRPTGRGKIFFESRPDAFRLEKTNECPSWWVEEEEGHMTISSFIMKRREPLLTFSRTVLKEKVGKEPL